MNPGSQVSRLSESEIVSFIYLFLRSGLFVEKVIYRSDMNIYGGPSFKVQAGHSSS